MAEARPGPPLATWRDELASLVADPIVVASSVPSAFGPPHTPASYGGAPSESSESLRDQIKGFAVASAEIAMELGRGCRDIVRQSFLTEDSYLVRKLGKPYGRASAKLSYFNEFLPEDRDPAHAWSVILFVFVLAFAAINVNNQHFSSVPPVKRARIHPPTATRVLLPDGRHVAYLEQGVPSSKARFSAMIPHSFLSSRLAGIPGIKISLLEEFGIRLVTYDLPGFGESDPDPGRNLNSSALDMLQLANAIGVRDKFWLLAHSGGAMHALAALKYIPGKVAGAALLAPMMNPYDLLMTKEELKNTWENWLPRRKFMYFLARRFPRFLTSFYRRSFLSGKLERIDKWLSLSLGKKDEILIEEPKFQDLWDRNLEESIRQHNVKPFIEEAVMQVSNWGFRLSDLQVQRRCQARGLLPWLKSIYRQAECELAGFLGPIHIWQGMDDQVVPPSMADYIHRVLPEAVMHKLPNEGHFSYFFFCDECHRQILSALFGPPRGPISDQEETEKNPSEENRER